MPSLYSIVYFLLHPRELRSVVQWKLWHEPVYRRDPARACETENKCFDFLNQTSRSFSAVILELHPELLMPICLFYLILRGLDTVEDDTSIPLRTKEPVLRNFHEHLEQDGWTFDGNRPEEKDRQLLVQFNNVVTEFKKIKPVYKEIIKDIAKRMGDGMADYCKRAELGDDKVETVKEYDLYCYYVAGLVGEGLTRLFVEAGFGHRALLERPNLFISMGLFLQKTNIIRDIKEDEDDERRFWPKAIWAKHVDNWEDLFNPEKRDAALNCSSEMILNALGHVEECLIYLSGLTEQSVFNFATIPQAMAIATLELCFRNYEMFGRNVKITKGDACQLMWQSTQNVQVTCNTFREYIRRVHRKNTPRDPNFLDISACCGKIESFIESLFPSQSPPQKNLKTRIIATEKPGETIEVPIEEEESNSETLFVAGTMLSFALGISLLVLFVAYLMGARLDIAFNQMKAGNFKPLIHQDL